MCFGTNSGVCRTAIQKLSLVKAKSRASQEGEAALKSPWYLP